MSMGRHKVWIRSIYLSARANIYVAYIYIFRTHVKANKSTHKLPKAYFVT
jgi:hypothetical protein